MIEKVSTEEKEKNYTQETKQSIYKKDVQAEDKESQVSPAKNAKNSSEHIATPVSSVKDVSRGQNQVSRSEDGNMQ